MVRNRETDKYKKKQVHRITAFVDFQFLKYSEKKMRNKISVTAVQVHAKLEYYIRIYPATILFKI